MLPGRGPEPSGTARGDEQRGRVRRGRSHVRPPPPGETAGLVGAPAREGAEASAPEPVLRSGERAALCTKGSGSISHRGRAFGCRFGPWPRQGSSGRQLIDVSDVGVSLSPRPSLSAPTGKWSWVKVKYVSGLLVLLRPTQGRAPGPTSPAGRGSAWSPGCRLLLTSPQAGSPSPGSGLRAAATPRCPSPTSLPSSPRRLGPADSLSHGS